MENSNISWTDNTFNAWTGCTKVSAGCKRCYAEQLMDKRYGKVKWGPDGVRLRTSPEMWKKPIRWNRAAEKSGKRVKVFCGSLMDVFEDNQQVSNWRSELFDLIDKTPMLDWQLLTKRPEKIFILGADAVGEVFNNWLAKHPNVWLGTSIENQEQAERRIPYLLNTCPSVRFLSVEPQIGRIDLINLSSDWGLTSGGINWVIVGGESGAGCNPFDISWAYLLRDACDIAGVPFFMKQLGGYPNKRHTLDNFPYDLRIREFPQFDFDAPRETGR
jgi:protein gp37